MKKVFYQGRAKRWAEMEVESVITTSDGSYHLMLFNDNEVIPFKKMAAAVEDNKVYRSNPTTKKLFVEINELLDRLDELERQKSKFLVETKHFNKAK